MNRKSGWFASLQAVLVEGGGPWGGKGSGGDGDDGGRPPNPWSKPPEGNRARPSRTRHVTPSMLDHLIVRIQRLFGGGVGGGGFPQAEGKPIWPYIVLGLILLWIAMTSIHRIGPEQAGVVTRFGKYATTLGPGVGFTLPAPIDQVEKLDIQAIRTVQIGRPGGNEDNLVLTGDQNLVDLAYSVRWNIKPGASEQFLFQLAEPETTIAEVAESAMRAVLANYTLIDAIGPGRTEIEQRVAVAMQKILDDYGAGVRIQGVAINQADPPGTVNEAFKEVTAAQQQVESNLNQARAYAQQVTARAQGEAAAFDKVYEQYKLAPEVTRRRMYYETMEKVLSKVDKTVVEAPGVMPYLPLSEIRKRAQTPETGQ